MTQVLVFVCEVESDQTHPEIGTYFDTMNTDWTFLDTRLAAVINPDEANHDLTTLVKEVL